MFERFTQDARTVVVLAQERAPARAPLHRLRAPPARRRLHRPAGGRRPARARRHAGTRRGGDRPSGRAGRRAGLFADLDRDALASIGIDLDAVRARIEASFGPAALTRADQAVHRRRRPSRLNPSRAVPPGLARRWHRRRRARRAVPAPPVPASTGLYQATGEYATGRIPFTPRAKKSLENSLREAQALHDNHIGVEHVALGLIVMNSGLVPPVLSALGVSAPTLRAAILDRYRQAS